MRNDINNFLQNDLWGLLPPFLFQETELLKYFLNILNENANFYKALYELNALKDSDLKELGLTRCEIPITVYNSMLEKYKYK